MNFLIFLFYIHIRYHTCPQCCYGFFNEIFVTSLMMFEKSLNCLQSLQGRCSIFVELFYFIYSEIKSNDVLLISKINVLYINDRFISSM